ncbi:LPS assembly lipoprotein LptE [Pseudochrobactrum sp. MP213Fo]|uniref:LPS assembly lipoprotein LptE n=1 Tax=Pseudochrobactrum sp. MP213Fo TaxID=3022250 RepID=UPI003BA3DF21
MSLFNHASLVRFLARIVRLPVLGALGLLVAGCTVQPLYSTSGSTTAGLAGDVSSSVKSRLASIKIDDVNTIYAQAVRNRLIFGLSGGAGEPAKPAYRLALGLQMHNLSAVEVDVGDSKEGRPSAGTVRMRSNYVLRDNAGKVVASGRREVSASYDRPRQEFANLRAQRDAQQRAAEELAQFLVLALAQDMHKLP